MSVYVDDLTGHGWQLHGRLVRSCHLFSDESVEELLAFGRRIGLKDSWLMVGSGRHPVPHFDLVVSKRHAAVSAGAEELDRRRTVEVFALWRKGGRLARA